MEKNYIGKITEREYLRAIVEELFVKKFIIPKREEGTFVQKQRCTTEDQLKALESLQKELKKIYRN